MSFVFFFNFFYIHIGIFAHSTFLVAIQATESVDSFIISDLAELSNQ